MKQVKAEKWSISIVDSVMDMIHGNKRSITEFYIPEFNISFNMEGETLHVFHTYKDRYKTTSTGEKPKKIKNLTVSEDFAKNLVEYLDLKKAIYDEGIVIAKKHA